MLEKAPHTHTAYALRRESRHRSRFIEIGHGSIAVGPDGVHLVVVDRLPVGGFTGMIYLSPVGVKPKVPESEPERPVPDAE